MNTDPDPRSVDAIPESILAAVRSDLATRSGASPAEISVVRARAMRWNDGAMGCPQPGQSYVQIIVDGYQVVLEARGTRYDYRASERGTFILCDRPASDDAGGQPRATS